MIGWGLEMKMQMLDHLFLTPIVMAIIVNNHVLHSRSLSHHRTLLLVQCRVVGALNPVELRRMGFKSRMGPSEMTKTLTPCLTHQLW